MSSRLRAASGPASGPEPAATDDRVDTSSRNPGRAWVVAVLAGVSLLVPLGFLVAVRVLTGDRLDEVTVVAEAVVTQAQTTTTDEAQPVVVTLQWQEPLVVRAPVGAGPGVVTDVYVTAGDEPSSGARLYAVDGVDRVALHTARPFHRPLRSGDRGDDVTQLQQVLADAGDLAVEPDGVFGRATREAVGAWQRRLGIARPDGVFDPGLVVWLPVPTLTVDSWTLAVGEPAPAPGAELLKAPPMLARAEIGVAADGAPALQLDSGAEYLLSVGDSSVAVVPEQLTIAPESLPELAASVEPLVKSVDGRVRRATALELVTIPATATMTGPSGTCVWAPGANGFSAQPVVVRATVGGQTQVDDGLDPSAQVLVNPATVLGTGASCP